MAFLLQLWPAETVQAAATTEMNIYSIYLDSTEKGESTLIESKGEYLLVDIGTASQSAAIVKQLNALGVTHVSVMFSHMHTDHIGASSTDVGAGLELLREAGFVIDKLYLPSPGLASLSTTYPARYARMQRFMSSQGTGRIIYLSANNNFSFGDVYARVIGPLNTGSLSPNKYTQYSTQKEREVYYENNCSIAVIFTCGNVKYFTAGDCYGDEAASLVSTYGSTLRCDIMKLCHHGVGSGNSEDMLAAIQPKYSVITNTGVTGKNESTGHWRVYNAYRRAAKYGLVYMLANEKKTLIYHVADNSITLYRGTTVYSGEKMTGWQYLYGADGKNVTHDRYYLTSDCKVTTGIKKIGGHYYYFSDGGQMNYGTYSSSGSYSGWKKYAEGTRYFKRSKDKKYAYMYVGLKSVNGRYYLFDDNGFKIMDDTIEEVAIVQIGSYKYAMDYEGEVTVKDIELIDGNYYYFNSYGHMVTDSQVKIGGEYYLFDENGIMIIGENGTQLFEFDNRTYAVRENGSLVTNKRGKVKGDTYYFNKKGVVQKNKIIKIGRKKYYFDEEGRMVTDSTFKFNGKKYEADEDGVLTRV
jgi:hypothetical protein